MRQHDDVELLTRARDAKLFPHDILQFRLADQRHRRERADGDDQPRPQQLNLAIEMRSAVGNLLRRRHAIAARFLIAARKASNHGANVNAASKHLLVDSERSEPAEEPPPGGVREWPPVLDFVRSRRLSDEHHLRARDGARHRLAENIRTKPARIQLFEMLREELVIVHR